jgi:hypothetical protein
MEHNSGNFLQKKALQFEKGNAETFSRVSTPPETEKDLVIYEPK